MRAVRQAETLAPGFGASIGQTVAPLRTAPSRCGVVQGPHHAVDWPPAPVDVLMHGLGGAGQG
jgi:hypothetical protein